MHGKDAMQKSWYQNFTHAFHYSFRSLWRNKRRTVLTVSTVALSVFVSIVANRYSDGIMRLWSEDATTTGLAQAQVHVRGFFEKTEGLNRDFLQKSGSPVESQLTGDRDVLGLSRRLEFEGIVSAGSKAIYFLGMAVNSGDELIVSPNLFSKKDLGSFLDESDATGVVIGKGLARILSVKPGDELSLMSQTVDGSMNAVGVVVRGIVDIPHPILSKRMVFTNLTFAQESLGVGTDYTELGIRLRPGVDVDKWVLDNKLTVANFDAELRAWWEIDPLIRNVEKIWNSVVGLIAGLLFVSAGISVLNIIHMLVSERTVEIGTLLALGARTDVVGRLFMAEATWIGLMGALLGGGCGVLVVALLGVVGVPFDSPFGSGIVLVRPVADPFVVVFMSSVAVLISLVAALVPSRRATKVTPVAAFRGQIT
jgi:putative ABC transport system permease protein